MRRILGWVALFVGAFLLMAAALGQFWAPNHAERTPLNVNTNTRLSGDAQKLDPTTGKVEPLKVKASNITKSDDKKSDDDVVVFVTTTCLVIDEGNVPDCVSAKDPQNRLISASSDVFAADRRTAMAVNSPKYLPKGSVPHEGLTNKWPFNAEKKTYPFWDGVLGKAVPATFSGTDTVDGLSTYTYDVNIPSTPAEVLQGVQGLYTQKKTIWIEPRTGAIVKQTQDETRTQANGDPLLTLNIVYTPQTIKTAVDDASSKADSLNLLTNWIPIIGLVGGLILVILGLALVLGGRRRGDHVATDS